MTLDDGPEAVDALFSDLEQSARSIEPDEAVARLFHFTKGMNRQAPRIPKGSTVYRARKLTARGHRGINSLRDVSYPRPEQVVSDGRCNLAGASMFYGATHHSPCFFEMRVVPGDFIVLTEWVLEREMLFQPLGYHSDVLRDLGASRDVPEWAGIINPTPTTLCFEKHVSRLFTALNPSADNYRLSALIAQMHTRGEQVDGIVYPSFAMWGNADNVAIKPRSAEEVLRAAHVGLYFVKSRGETTIDVEQVDTASIGHNGALRWKGHRDQWTLRGQGEVVTVRSNGYRWIGYDEMGRERAPDP